MQSRPWLPPRGANCDTGGMSEAPESYLQRILRARVYDVAIESPLDPAPNLSARLHNRVLLKREDLQPVFSFKLRGAYNKMVHLSPQARAQGVICASAGNHAQGVALASTKCFHQGLGLPCCAASKAGTGSACRQGAPRSSRGLKGSSWVQ